MDIREYFMRWEDQAESRGAFVQPAPRPMFRPAEDSDRRGIIRGFLGLTENAFLSVYERLDLDRPEDPRIAYKYTLVIDGAHHHRWDNDPKNHPDDPVHEHAGPGETRMIGTDRMPLTEVIETAWEMVSLQEEAPGP